MTGSSLTLVNADAVVDAAVVAVAGLIGAFFAIFTII